NDDRASRRRCPIAHPGRFLDYWLVTVLKPTACCILLRLTNCFGLPGWRVQATMWDEVDPLRFQCYANSRRSEVEICDVSEPSPSRFRRGMRIVIVVPCPTSLHTSSRNERPNNDRSRRRSSPSACTRGCAPKK